MKNTTRIQIDLPASRVKELEQLMREAGIDTKKELVLNALTLFTWGLRETKEGRKIAAMDEKKKTYYEVLLPAFDAIRSSGSSGR